MARIRSLKPEFFLDRKLARNVSRDARLFYTGLWTMADEHSRVNGDPRVLKGQLMPYDDDVTGETISGWLGDLENHGAVRQYFADGDPYLFLPKLAEHQRLETKVDSRLPAPPDPSPAHTSPSVNAEQRAPHADEPAPDPDPHADKSASHADKSSLLYVAGSREQVAGCMEQGAGGTHADLSASRSPPTRASRLPRDWQPDGPLVDWTLTHLDASSAQAELEKFRDYWHAKSGQGATKHDWDGTWRNWVRRAGAESPTKNGRRQSTTDQRVAAGRALTAELKARGM